MFMFVYIDKTLQPVSKEERDRVAVPCVLDDDDDDNDDDVV